MKQVLLKNRENRFPLMIFYMMSSGFPGIQAGKAGNNSQNVLQRVVIKKTATDAATGKLLSEVNNRF